MSTSIKIDDDDDVLPVHEKIYLYIGKILCGYLLKHIKKEKRR